MKPMYFDYAASAPLDPEVIEVMQHALAHCGNPSSIHAYGKAAMTVIETARVQVAG